MPPAHSQAVTRRYVIHYPAHEPREDDPHFRDFRAYRLRTRGAAQCRVGAHRGDFSECGGQLELHHSHIEFALANSVDLKWLEADYPGVSDPDQVGAWVESAANLEWLCERHHRSAGGVHSATASDYAGEQYVRGLISASTSA